ncbi:MAG: PD-(D/E)XK nuclease family protein [Planctomycetota bacterium]
MKLFSTSCETLFLGWDAPLIPAAASTLRKRLTRGHRLDLSDLIYVLPTSHGAAEMKRRMDHEAKTHDLHYDPPKIITVGQMAEHLYQPPNRLALELEQTLAWTRVIRGIHPDQLKPLLPTIPAPEPVGPWLEIAGAINRLHAELSTSQLTFRDIVEFAETDLEKRRWKLLNQIYNEYLSALNEAGLSDPHASRRDAVMQNRCHCDQTVVLIGTSDLSDALISMLRSLDSNLMALVAAPASESARFDEFGCVDTASWLNKALPVRDEHLVAAENVADQAEAVAELLAELANHYRTHEVTVGVTDESHVGPIETELRGCGVETHRFLGWTVAETSIGRLLDLTAAHLARRSWATLAALVRHADVAAYLSRHLGTPSHAWLTELDQLRAEFFPVHVDDPLPKLAAESCPLAQSLAGLVAEWLRPLRAHEQSIAEWARVVSGWLQDLYPGELEESGQTEWDEPLEDNALHDRTKLAIRATLRLLERYGELNDRLDLRVGGATAIEMLSARLADVRVAEPFRSGEVSLLGWLDLALDDAKLLVVNGLNHPFVPAGVTSDPFLPGTLRGRLRMEDNNRRYARDAYAMHLMISTRDDVRFIVGSTAADQSPTPPSRLLASAPGADLARRICGLIGQPRIKHRVAHDWHRDGQHHRLPIPKLAPPTDEPVVTSMSVTAFADYLRCPYRFYLRHVLNLKPLDDESNELAANQFGNLVHAALEQFGLSDQRNESDPNKIESLLLEHLHQFAEEYYGDSVSTAVTLQIAQAEKRLKAVAGQQAKRISDGWQIHAAEASVNESDGAILEVDGHRMGLRGRFDRIDHHPATNRWAILDYKTHGHRPEKKHLKKTEEGDQWVDLQLPLYRLMIPYLGINAEPSEVQLGYFNVSEKDEETRINIAEFSSKQMDAAQRLIRQCVADVCAGKFEPSSDRIQYDDYGMILQTSVANRLLDRVEWLAAAEVES